MREEFLMSGPLEPTNETYSLAKIAGIKLCQAYAKQCGDNFICAQPANVYGPYDNFDPKSAMVIPSLINKVLSSKDTIEVWGDGSAIRDFIFSRDVARGMMLAVEKKIKKLEKRNIGRSKKGWILEIADDSEEEAEFQCNRMDFLEKKTKALTKQLITNL